MSRLILAVLGVAIGGGVAVLVLALVLSVFVMGACAFNLLVQRRWVPLQYSVQSVFSRRKMTLLTVAGLALVTGIFAGVCMLAQGIESTMVATGRDSNVIVLRKGTQTESESELSLDVANLIGTLPSARGEGGTPAVAAPQMVVFVDLQAAGAARGSGAVNVAVRGTSQAIAELHPEVRIVAGRMLRSGTNEAVIGSQLRGRFAGFDLGGTVTFAQRQWTVVGVADSGGSSFDSEIWVDLDQALDAFHRRPTVTSALLRAPSAERLNGELAGDPRFSQLEAKTEKAYYASQSTNLKLFVRTLGLFNCFLFGIGAVLGAMITMFNQVAVRTREVGVLRALGFQRRAILAAFVTESLLVGAVAGALGVAGSALLQLRTFSITNVASLNDVTFHLRLSPGVALGSIAFALLLGYSGGLWPAFRAARMPLLGVLRGK